MNKEEHYIDFRASTNGFSWRLKHGEMMIPLNGGFVYCKFSND
ncbi:hypothetical protein [Algibacter mikhailovii]|nr:hypothetical protein [Algibacter mikhailovii]